MLVWSMCEWSGHNVRVLVSCASASLVNVRVVRFVQHRNVRVVRFLQHWNVRVLVWSMCEWSGYNVRVSMECASASTVMCE